jgi:Zn-dependent protease
LLRTLPVWLREHASTLCGAGATYALAPAFQRLSGDQVQYVAIGLIIAFLVISLSVHEAAHAWVADLRGDPTARELGRITLNPLAHIGLFETILLPLMLLLASGGALAFGGAKPVPVNYHRLKHPLRDMMLVAIAGPLSNVVLAAVFMLAFKAAKAFGGYEGGELLTTVLKAMVFSNLLLAVFNMLPVPPLDGSRVMAWLLPSGIREPYVRLERVGLLLVMGVWFLVPDVRPMVISGVYQAQAFLDQVTGGTW